MSLKNFVVAAMLAMMPTMASATTLTFEGQTSVSPLISYAQDGFNVRNDQGMVYFVNDAISGNGHLFTGLYGYPLFGSQDASFDITSSSALFTMTSFDFQGTLQLSAFDLGSITVTGFREGASIFRELFSPQNVQNQTLALQSSASPVDRITVATHGFIINLDNFVVDRAVAAVPEPATWAMMVGGFGMMGVAMRRRRRQATVALA